MTTQGTDDPFPECGAQPGEQAAIECPKCGDEFGCLPLHLPGCDG